MIFIKINIYYVIFIKISDILDFYKNQGGCPAPGGRVVIFINFKIAITDFYKFQRKFIKITIRPNTLALVERPGRDHDGAAAEGDSPVAGAARLDPSAQ